jgi:hypothetical protein
MLTIENLSPRPVSLNPLAFRYSTATRSTYTSAGGKQRVRTRRLWLELGSVLNGWERFVPAASLVELGPGRSFERTCPLSPETSPETLVFVQFEDRFRVCGETPAPRLVRLPDLRAD